MGKINTEYQEIFHVQKCYLEIRAINEMLWKTGVELHRAHSVCELRGRYVDTHSEYVILMLFH